LFITSGNDYARATRKYTHHTHKTFFYAVRKFYFDKKKARACHSSEQGLRIARA